MTRLELQAELERIEGEITQLDRRASRTADPRRLAGIEKQLAGLRDERAAVFVDITEAELREMRDSPHPPEAIVPRRSVGPVFGALLERRGLVVAPNMRRAG